MTIRCVRTGGEEIRFVGLLAIGMSVVLAAVFGDLGATADAQVRHITFGAVEAEEGVYVLPILIDEMEGVLSGHMEVAFDGTKVREVTARKSDLMSNYMFVSMSHEDRVVMSFAAASSTPGSGRIAEIRFEALEPDADLVSCFWFLSVQVNEGMIQVVFPGMDPEDPKDPEDPGDAPGDDGGAEDTGETGDTPEDNGGAEDAEETGDTPEGPTPVGSEEDGDTPGRYVLDQNYPNPFNAGTRIRYILPSDGAAELSVYALDGRRVRTLTRGYRGAGSYEMAWDGRNEMGEEAASGAYLYRLRAGQISLVRRMVLMR